MQFTRGFQSLIETIKGPWTIGKSIGLFLLFLGSVQMFTIFTLKDYSFQETVNTKLSDVKSEILEETSFPLVSFGDLLAFEKEDSFSVPEEKIKQKVSTQIENLNKSEDENKDENNSVLVQSLEISNSEPSPTLTQTSNQSNDSSDSQSSSVLALQPTSVPTPTSTPISIPTLMPTSMPTPTPTNSPTPTNTPVPDPDPTATPTEVSNQIVSLYMTAPAQYTRNGHANVDIEVVKNANGFWDFIVSASMVSLEPNRQYQFWLCGNGCSSHESAKFLTDDQGNASFSGVVIEHHQGGESGDLLTLAKIYEPPPQGAEIPDDPTACFMITNSSIPCLSREVSFGN